MNSVVRPQEDPLELGIEARARGEQAKLVLRVDKLRRFASRLVAAPELSIFGCYDAGNVGDFALGQTLLGIANSFARAALDSPRGVRLLTPPRALVLGGGGVVTTRPNSPVAAFAKYAARRAAPPALSVVGVSCTLGGEALPADVVRVLKSARWLSARSRSSADAMAKVAEREVVVQPDIAFAFRRTFGKFPLPRRLPKRFVFNVSPFLHGQEGKKFVARRQPSPWFKRDLPDQAQWYERIGPQYATLMRELAGDLARDGWQLAAVPLAPEDDLFARALFQGVPVHCEPYSPDPRVALERFASAERALATRFHAHVFCMLTQTPFGSIAYSPKCSDLLQDLAMNQQAQVSPHQWVHERAESRARLLQDGSVALLSNEGLARLEQEAFDASRRGLMAALDGS